MFYKIIVESWLLICIWMVGCGNLMTVANRNLINRKDKHMRKRVKFLKICENDICFSNVWWRRICDEWAVMLTRGFTGLMTWWVFLVSELWKREGLLLVNIEWKASRCVWYSSLISEEGKCAGKENPILLLIGWEF